MTRDLHVYEHDELPEVNLSLIAMGVSLSASSSGREENNRVLALSRLDFLPRPSLHPLRCRSSLPTLRLVRCMTSWHIQGAPSNYLRHAPQNDSCVSCLTLDDSIEILLLCTIFTMTRAQQTISFGLLVSSVSFKPSTIEATSKAIRDANCTCSSYHFRSTSPFSFNSFPYLPKYKMR